MNICHQIHIHTARNIYYLLSTIFYLLSGVATTVAAPKAPLTYSGDHIGPYPGFSWSVSRHYAILSDMDEKDVRDALDLLELAWPHYVRTFQWRPPASETHRQAIVLASSRSVLEDCLLHDCLHAPLLGGLTQEGYACSYLYAGAPYQTRYILLHEATHLYQYCLSGDTRSCYGFLLEGIADYLSSHIYNPDDRTLTVNVLDRAPIHNHLAEGLADWKRLGNPSFSTLLDNPSPSRGLSVLMVAFLQRTPETAAKWHLFCERIVRDMAQKDAKRTTFAALRDLYGEPKSLDAPFAKWLASLKPTFNLIDRDFDQSAPGVFTALPPSNVTARLTIDVSRVPETGTRDTCILSRPTGAGACAGLIFLGQTFAMSNTWSGGCVFSVSHGDAVTSAEVPVAFMRNFKSPFVITFSVTNGTHAITVADANDLKIVSPFTLAEATQASFSSSPTLTLFASGAPVRFEVPALMVPKIVFPSDNDEPHAHPEITFPDFSNAVTEWEIIGPFSATEAAKAGIIPPADAAFWGEDGTRLRWRRSPAHPATPITPPLLNLNELFGRQANGLVAYAQAEIESEADKTVTLVLGVADRAEVFLNGQRIATKVGKREWADGNLRIENVQLRKGSNQLRIRLVHSDSAWLLSARLQRDNDQIVDNR